MMKGRYVQVPVVDFEQERLTKRDPPSEVEVVSGVFEVVYLEVHPSRHEVQFLRLVLVIARVCHSWLNKSKSKSLKED